MFHGYGKETLVLNSLMVTLIDSFPVGIFKKRIIISYRFFRRSLQLYKERFHCVKSVCIASFFGPYFPAFGLNTERQGVFLRIQSKRGKIRTRIILNTDSFHAMQKVRFMEKLTITKTDPESLLNTRNELVSKYRHMNKFRLKIFERN